MSEKTPQNNAEIEKTGKSNKFKNIINRDYMPDKSADDLEEKINGLAEMMYFSLVEEGFGGQGESNPTALQAMAYITGITISLTSLGDNQASQNIIKTRDNLITQALKKFYDDSSS